MTIVEQAPNELESGFTMTATWINISTEWSLSTVQASLNVIVSVLGTIGIWSFSRYWWQRGNRHVLRGGQGVPLSSLLTLSSPGEGWDALVVLRKKLFAKENWRVLLQFFVIVVVTTACMLAGPIAKASLRSTRTVQIDELEVLKTSKGDSFLANRVSAEVQWNDTMQSLDLAGFPYDQLLDYLPPVSAPWIYTPSEWDSTWVASCNQHDETVIQLEASGNATWAHPLDAFPRYRESYDPLWLNESEFRFQADFSKEWAFISEREILIKDAIFWVLIQSDPEVDDRMYTNNATLHISLTAVHAHNFRCDTGDDATQAGLDNWRPIGPVENASYSRVECNLTRNAASKRSNDKDAPWLWTNDTHSITNAYRTYWATPVGEKSSKNLTITPPSPEELFRFYQAYMVSVNTWLSRPTLQNVSVWKDTVQLQSTTLAILIFLVLLEIWLAVRYFWFLRRHKTSLQSRCVPDGKLEWMIHAARLASQELEEEAKNNEKKNEKDRDFLRKASFGNVSDVSLQPLELARVHMGRGSLSRSGVMRSNTLPDLSFLSRTQRPHLTVQVSDENGRNRVLDDTAFPRNTGLPRGARSMRSLSSVTILPEEDGASCCQCSNGSMLSPTRSLSSRPMAHLDDETSMLSPTISRTSSTGRGRSPRRSECGSSVASVRSIKLSTVECDPKVDVEVDNVARS